MTFDNLFKKRQESNTSKHSDAQTSEYETPPSSKNSAPKEDVQTSEHLNAQTSKEDVSQTEKTESNIQTSEHSKIKTSNAKSKNKGYTRTTFYIPKDTHQRLKIASINQEEDMSEIVTRLIEEWLKQSDA